MVAGAGGCHRVPVITLLLSDEACFAAGATFVIGGGQTMQ